MKFERGLPDFLGLHNPILVPMIFYFILEFWNCELRVVIKITQGNKIRFFLLLLKYKEITFSWASSESSVVIVKNNGKMSLFTGIIVSKYNMTGCLL